MLAAPAYIALFLASFGAATVLPMQSEAVLSAMLLSGKFTPWLLVTVASIGNTLGAAVNWGLGRGMESFQGRKWFPVRGKDLARAKNWYARYGRWSLLLSWMPFAGDALTVAAGALGEKFHVFLILVAIAKTGRYIVLAFLILG